MKAIALFILSIIIPMSLISQDTILQKDMSFEKGKWQYKNSPFTGVSTDQKAETVDYYSYSEGEINGYYSLYINGDTAGIHIYEGKIIHMRFYNKMGKKTLEYSQKILDNNYTFGPWKQYDENGNLKVSGNYSLIKEKYTGRGGQKFKWKSVKDGKWVFYDENGNIVRTEVWRNDRKLK